MRHLIMTTDYRANLAQAIMLAAVQGGRSFITLEEASLLSADAFDLAAKFEEMAIRLGHMKIEKTTESP